MLLSDIQKHSTLILCLALTAATLAVFGQVRDHDFITYDDCEYVVQNPHVRPGLTLDGLAWALTSTRASNWHPLSWLSHMTDCDLYGLNPSGHHLNSLLFHAANTLLLLLLLKRMTGALWRSFLVAALFALHPLHVESVAWVAERKDVLSALFWMLTLLAYAGYSKRPGIRRYLLALAFFGLGLMAKPMLVTLPFVMLLLDYWPLRRLKWERAPTGLLLMEKIPFFLLSAATSVVTFMVQQKWGAVVQEIPLGIRFANALCSYGVYLAKVFWPISLAFHYPHPLGSIPAWQVAGSGVFLVCMTYLSFRFSSRLPYLTVGWLWYLGTLIPVIGIIQVGSHAMADRYTYIPLIGPFIALSWGTADITSRWPRVKGPSVALWICLLVSFGIGSWVQAETWKDSMTLYRHAIRVTAGNLTAHQNLGNVLAREGRLNEAAEHIREVLRLRPGHAPAHNNLANVLVKQGRIDEGIAHYREALRIRPDFPEARFNLELAMERNSQKELEGTDEKRPPR